MQFSDVIGQQEIKTLLRRQLEEGHVPHAQLFCGAAGSGQLAMALAYASALLCRHPQAQEACGQCPSCKMLESWCHPDLHFVFPVVKPAGSSEAVSDLYLREWREQLADTPYFDHLSWLRRIGVENQQSLISVAESDLILRKLSLAASQGGYKVMIIWLPEQMNAAAANKLLKILEEPPGQTVFLLVSEHPERLLSTILSRTQQIVFPALTTADLEQVLTERHHLQPDDARTVARLSTGSYVRALQEVIVHEDNAMFFDLFVLLMRLSYLRKIKDLHEWAEQVASWGRERQKNFLDYCQRLVRENFIYNFRQPELNYLNRKEADFAVNFARFINERNVIPITEEIADAQRDIEQNVNPHMVFFDFALKMIVLLLR